MWPGHIRMLLYPTLFDDDPLAAVDRKLTFSARDHATIDFLSSVRLALASDEDLSQLLPGMRHSDEALRRFLREIERRLSGAATSPT